MEVKKFLTTNNFINESTDFIAHVCRNSDGIVRIGLSGGSTPKSIYKEFSRREDIKLEKVKFFQVDERYVPKFNENSNYDMIYHNLIERLNHRIIGFYYFDTSLSIRKCINKYEKDLNEIKKRSFDLVILGIGTDGHVASLFPHSKALKEEKRLAIHTTTDEFEVKDRLTISLPIIMESRKILVLLSGKKKEKILNEILHSSKSIDELPAKALLDHKNLTIYFYNPK